MSLSSEIRANKKKNNSNETKQIIKNTKLMNVIRLSLFLTLLIADIFYIIKENIIGISNFTNTLLIISIILEGLIFVGLLFLRFNTENKFLKVTSTLIYAIPIIAYVPMMTYGDGFSIILFLIRIVLIGGLLFLATRDTQTVKGSKFVIKQIGYIFMVAVIFVVTFILLISSQTRRVVYSYDDAEEGYVVKNVLKGYSDVEFKEGTIKISDNSLTNAGDVITIPSSVVDVSKKAFVDSEVKEIHLNSSNITIISALLNSNVEKVYVNDSNLVINDLSLASRKSKFKFYLDKDSVDEYREKYRKYDYLFVPKCDDGELYVAYNNTSLPIEYYKDGDLVNAPNVPSTNEKRFKDWDYAFNVGLEKPTLPLNIHESLDLFATWNKVYKISLEYNGGTVTEDSPSIYKSMPNSIYVIIDDGDVKLPTLQKSGYRFDGWYYDDNQLDDNKINASEIDDMFVGARFSRIFKLKYHENGGYIPDTEKNQEYVDGDYIIPATPERLGYEFDGWYDNAELQGNRIEVVNNYNIDLYAKWKLVAPKVTLSNDINKVYDGDNTALSVIINHELMNEVGYSCTYTWYKEDENGVQTLNSNDNHFVKNVQNSKYYCVIKISYLGSEIEVKSDYINVNITKAEYDLSSIDFSMREYEYNGKPQFPKLDAIKSIGDGKLSIIYDYVEDNVTKVGSGIVTYKFSTDSTNYNAPEEKEIIIKINPKSLSVNFGDTLVHTYSGSIHNPNGTLVGVIDNEDVDLAIEEKNTINVGTYSVKLSLTGSNSVNYKLANNEISYEIVKANYDYTPTFNTADLKREYDGSVYIPMPNNLPEDVTVSNLTSGLKDVTSNSSITYIFETSNSNYNSPSNYTLRNIEITKRTITLDVINSELTYNGQVQNPEVKLNNIVVSEDVSIIVNDNNINSGEYTVQSYEIIGANKNNYVLDLKHSSLNYKIKKAEVSIEWSNLEFEYDGQIHKPTAIAKVNNSNISFEVETTGAINAGNDHISYASTNANYDIIANESHEFVILKKNITLEWDNNLFTFNGKLQKPEASLIGLISGDNVNIDYDYENSINVGNYSITASITSDNYSLFGTNLSYDYVIGKASIEDNILQYIDNGTIVIPEETVYEYDGNVHYPDVKVNGNIITSNRTSIKRQYLGSIVEYGEKYISLEFSVDSNYESYIIDNLLVKITKKNISLILDKEYEYTGDAITPNVVLNGVLDADKDNVSIEVLNTDSIIVKEEAYILDYELSGSKAKNYQVDKDYEFYIISKTIDITGKFTILDYVGVYDGNEHTVSVNIDSEISAEAIISTSYKTVCSGEIVRVEFVSTDDNYKINTSAIGYVTINKRTLDISLNSEELIYNGEILVPTVTILNKVGNEDINVCVTNNSINSSSYKATFDLTGLDSDNYVLGSYDLEYIIKPRGINVNWSNLEFVYNNISHKPAAEAINLINGDTCNIDVIVESGAIDAGNYVAKAVSANNNYYVLNSTVNQEFTINKASIPYEKYGFKDVTYTYDGEEHAPTTNMQTQYTDYNHAINYEILNYVSDYGLDQEVKIKFSSTSNYEETIVSYKVTINKREVQLLFKSLVFTYSDESYQPVINGYTGLISGDDFNVTMNRVYSEIGEYVLVENEDYIVEGNDKDNYSIIGTYIVKIVVEPQSLKKDYVITPYSGVYDGKPHTPTVTNLPTGVTPVFSITYTDVCDSATVTITFDSGQDDIIYDNIETSTVTITKRLIKVSLINNELIYNGNIQMPQVSIDESNLVLGDNVEVKVITNNESINVGNYELTLQLSNSNYVLSYESDLNYSIVKCPVEIEWTNTELEYSKSIMIPSAKAKYDGNVLDILVTVTTNKESINVGNYTATAAITDQNYEIALNATTDFEITPYVVDISWTNTTFVYENKLFKPTASITFLEGDNPQVDVLIKDNIEAIKPGTYYAYCYIYDDNYKVKDEYAEFVIKKGSIESDIPNFNSISSYEYDGTAKKPTIDSINNYYAKNGEQIEWRYSSNEYINVGTYNDEIIFYTDSGYYNEYKVKVVTEITAKELDIVFDNSIFEFNNAIQKPNVIINNLVSGDELIIVVTNNSYKVSEYEAEFEITGIDKNNYVINGKYKYYITKGNLDMSGIQYDDLEVVYDGEYHLPTISNAPAGISIDKNNSTGVKYVTDNKATIKFALDENYINNYNVPEDVVVSMTVNKKSVSINWDVTEFEYDGKTHRPTYEINGAIAGDSIELIFDSEDQINRGNYIAHVSGVDNSNYVLTGELSTNYTIAKGTYDMSSVVFKSSEFTYDKTSHKITITGTLPKGADGISVTVEYDYGNVSIINVGEYEVKANFNGSDNYKDIPSITATITIVPRTIELSWAGLYTHVYDNNSYKPNAIATGVLTGDSCNVTVSGEAINAGSHLATVELDNDNYALNDYTKEFIIQKANYDMSNVKFEYDELVYNGKLQHQTINGLDTVIGLDDSTPYVVSYDGGAKNVNDGEKEVVVNFGTDSINYNVPESMTSTVSITPMEISVVVSIEGTEYSDYYNRTPHKTYDAKEMIIEASFNNDQLIEGDSLELSIDIAPVVVGTHKYTILFENSNYTTSHLNGTVGIDRKYVWWINWSTVNGIPHAYSDSIELTEYSYGDSKLYYVYYDSDNNVIDEPTQSGSYTVELVNNNSDNIYVNTMNSSQSFDVSRWSFDGQFVNNNVTYNESARAYNTEFTYDSVTYEYGLKMESSTQITIKVTSAGYYTFVVSPEKKIRIGNSSYTASSDGSIRVYLSTGSYSVTKNTTDTGLYAIIK